MGHLACLRTLYLRLLNESSLTTTYSVDIFSYSGPSGILGSDDKQNTAYVGARGARIVAFSISSHEQAQ